MDKNISSAKTWKILRQLIDPGKSKTEAQQLKWIAHQYPGTTKDLLAEVTNRYLKPGHSGSQMEYTGINNPTLDNPITVGEVRAEINRLKTKTAAGLDKVTNQTLRNLDENSIIALTKYIQECWEERKIPQVWKQAKLVLIPKPGKTQNIENLRPISLTSCVGKVMEHVIQRRLQRYLEEEEIYPDTMIGFTEHL